MAKRRRSTSKKTNTKSVVNENNTPEVMDTSAEEAVTEEAEPESAPEAESEAETVTEPKAVSEAESEGEPEPEAVPTAEPETAPKQETVPEQKPEPESKPKPAITTIKETDTLMKVNNKEKEPVSDVMPEFLRSANSTIRRDGPYKEYSGNADILRHAEKKDDGYKGRSRKKKRKARKRESYIASETISLIALAAIILVIFICAIKHVEFSALSLPALLITSVITVAMGIFLGEAPAYVSLILVALIVIAGAVTGMFSEVITGVVIFLCTVTAIKGKFD